MFRKGRHRQIPLYNALRLFDLTLDLRNLSHRRCALRFLGRLLAACCEVATRIWLILRHIRRSLDETQRLLSLWQRNQCYLQRCVLCG